MASKKNRVATAIYQDFDYFQDYGQNKESFYARNINSRLAFRGPLHSKKRIHLRFLSGRFYYGRRHVNFNNINTVYASAGSFELDFSKMHKNMNIVTGTGDDIVQVGKGRVDINMGNGNDTLEIGTLVAYSNYDGGAGSDTMVFTNKNVNATLTDSNLSMGQKTARVRNFSTFRASKGRARLNFSRFSKRVNIYTGDGSDTVYLGRGRTNLYLGNGNDSAVLEKSVNRSVIDGGRGYDTIELSGKNVTANFSNNSLNILGGTTVLKNMEAVVATNGNVTINTSYVNKNFDITTGNGDDTIVLGRGSTQVSAGAGDDVIAIREALGRNSSIDAGLGYDTLDLSGLGRKAVLTDESIKIGRNKAEITGFEAVTVNRGLAEIDALNFAGELDITTANRSDIISVGAGSTNVDAGDGANTITMYGSGTHKVKTGQGDDSYYLAKGSINISDAGGDNSFEIVVNGKDAAKSVDINLGEIGDNTLTILRTDLNNQDVKSWLESRQFNLTYANDGTSELTLGGLGTTEINLSGVKGQQGQIEFYASPRQNLFSVDFASLVWALENGGATKGLTFTNNGSTWVAEVANNATPLNISYNSSFDVHNAASVNQDQVESSAFTLAQEFTGSQGNSVTIEQNLGALTLTKDASGQVSYNYKLKVNQDPTKANFDALGEASKSELGSEVFKFNVGDDKAKISIDFKSSAPNGNLINGVLLGSTNNDTLNFDQYGNTQAVYAGLGDDVINFGSFGQGQAAYGGLGQDTYNVNYNAVGAQKIQAVEHGSDADAINFFGLSLLSDPTEIAQLLNNLTFSLTKGGNQELTLTISQIVPDKPDFSLTTVNGSFANDKVNFYGTNLAQDNSNELMATIDLESLVKKLVVDQPGVNLSFTQDSEVSTKFNAN